MLLDRIKDKVVKRNKEKTGVTTIRVEESTRYLIEVMAERMDITPNELIKVILNEVIAEASEDDSFLIPEEYGLTFPDIIHDGNMKFGDFAEKIRLMFRSGALSYSSAKEEQK